MLFAHHVAVELFGREFSPRTPLEHICTSRPWAASSPWPVMAAWTLATKAMARTRGKVRA